MTTYEAAVYEFGEFRMDVRERQLLRKGRPIPLTAKVTRSPEQFRLMASLLFGGIVWCVVATLIVVSRPDQPSWRRTSAATAPPSARPLVWPCTAPMTLPIARMPSSRAPVDSIASATRTATSSSPSCSGR